MRDHAETYEESEDRPVNPSTAPRFADVLAARCRRRTVLQGGAALGAAVAAGPLPALLAGDAAAGPPRVAFAEIAHGVDETHHVAPGYAADVLIRWGDPVTADAPPFDPYKQSAAAQERQFGYNNDYIGFVPLGGGAARGLLCVNHEYTNRALMFPGAAGGPAAAAAAAIEMAAHGGTIIEVERREGGRWSVVPDSRYARRISARSTAMRLSGPAAGHPRLRTGSDPAGATVVGTFNNCAGGITPWGTYLMAEENFHGYFMGALDGHPEAANHRRYGVPGGWYEWGRFDRRFDVAAEPREANRFGWVVEVDPLDPASVPVKRTALGRFKHEGAETVVNGDGRVVIYSGDDQRFEYLYKFVSHGRFDPDDRDANRDLLDAGTLFAARFDSDGTLAWLPLVWGTGPLTPGNGFASQADVLIEARRAADRLGATPMDRPEDVQPNPATRRVYVALTNNSRRTPDRTDAANPRAPNLYGHIVELTPPGGDHAALGCRWDILVKCGNPRVPAVAASWNPATSENGWFASPDNLAVDGRGRLWVATDQGGGWWLTGTADGVWSLATEGAARGTGRMFFRVPVGAELCGPCFTPDDSTLFVAVQHPAADGVEDYEPFGRASTFDDPATRWPDFAAGVPPRPSVVAITKDDGGPIGS